MASLAGAVGSLFSPGFNVSPPQNKCWDQPWHALLVLKPLPDAGLQVVTNDTFHTLAPGVQPLTVYTGAPLQLPGFSAWSTSLPCLQCVLAACIASAGVT